MIDMKCTLGYGFGTWVYIFEIEIFIHDSKYTIIFAPISVCFIIGFTDKIPIIWTLASKTKKKNR